MAKRFTETGKWDKQSFSDLSLKMKVVWVYLCDKCDHAGIWDINLKLLSFQIGEPVSLDEILEGMGDRVELATETKLIVKGFVDFQYGHLNPENRVHKSVLERLEKIAPSKPLKRPSKGSKDTDTNKDANTNKEKGESEGILKSKALEIYKRYPRKKGKTAGIKRLVSDFKKGYTPEEANVALDRHIADLKAKGTAPEFVPYFSSWASEWHDALDDDHGHAQDFSANADVLDPSQFVKPGGAA